MSDEALEAENEQLRVIIGNLADLVEKMKAEGVVAHLFHDDEWHTAVQQAIDSARRRADRQ